MTDQQPLIVIAPRDALPARPGVELLTDEAGHPTGVRIREGVPMTATLADLINEVADRGEQAQTGRGPNSD
ncbi:hypothetical protein JOD54_001963 [Actinokineospora baliensis]|uniref:hypothetical protein n=1 Tax=Actinokineospora baliensis TaxID=547056 RepID=UPI00195C320B|nr:hypothetical protein [Actinokineospora baliensis]MBM7771759.1 hypothetical protein [Actinokineospora baliensis]